MKKILLFLSFLLMSISVWGEAITITAESGIKSSYGSGGTFTVDEAEFWYSGVMYNGKGSPALAAAKSFIQLRKSGNGAGEIKNNTELALKSITIATQNDKDFTLSVGPEADALDAVEKPNGTTGTYQFVDKDGKDASCDVTIYTFDVEGNAYFDILNSSNASYFAYIAIELDNVTPTKYTVTYDANGGTGIMTDSNSPYNSGATVTVLENTFTAPSCKQFSKWFNKNDEEISGSFTITKDTVLYAQWEDIPTYSVTLKDSDVILIQSDCNDSVTLPSREGCEGYTFIGWSTTNNSEWTTTQPTILTGTYKPNNNIDLYPVYTKTETSGGGSSSLVKMNSGSVFNNGDKIIIVATGTTVALYQETHANTYVEKWVFDNDVETAKSDDKKWLSLSTGDEPGEWYIGDATNGYLYNPSDNNLKCDVANHTSWVLTDNGDGTFKLIGNRCLSYRNDGSNNYWRMGGVNCNSGTPNLDIYKYSSGETVTTYYISSADCSEEPPTPPTPEENIVDIIVWDTAYIKVDINDTAVVAVSIENKKLDVVNNVANELFFSKYFEAGGNNKMLAFFNGTEDTLNLNHYTFKLANVAGEVNLGNYGNYHDSLMLPNTEILFVHYDKKNSAKDCADDIEGYQNWIEVPDDGILHQHTNFGGRTSLALFKNGSLIDIIGMHLSGTPLAISTSKITCTSAIIDGYNDSEGFYTYNGDNIKTNEEENNYFLSTNRCLLVRKNNVKDGANAVSNNTYSEINACNDTVALQFKTLAQEWMGYQIGNGNNDQALIDSTCTGLAYAGHYNYGNYYGSFTQIYENDSLPGILAEDSSYAFVLTKHNLDTLPCTDLKFTLTYRNGTEKEELYKVPIFIYSNSVISSFPSLHKDTCKNCDVVILKGGTLQVDSSNLENRNVFVYPGGRLIVPKDTIYKAKSLTLRRENDSVPHMLNNGTITLENDSNYFFELRTNAADWRWIALPADHKISNIKQHNGKPIELSDSENDKEVYIKHYNGLTRAITHRNGWDYTPMDSTLMAGQGFIFGVDLPGEKMKIYKFTFPSADVNNENSEKTIPGLHAWGCDTIKYGKLAPNHKGWNLIGNPFADTDTTDFIEPIRFGKLVKTDTNPWDGKWEVDSSEINGKKLRYAVMPVPQPWSEYEAAAGGYASEILDDYKLLPFTCFFVQIGGDEAKNQSLTFQSINAQNPINRIVARSTQYDEDEELFLRVMVGNGKTGCFISNKFTDEYEPGDDLESRYPIYQSIGGYKLLYSAINDSIIEHGVQVTAPQGTLYLDPKVNVGKFEYIYAYYDSEWYDLKSGQTAEVNGTFILQAKRKVKDTPTSLEDIIKSGTTDKFIYNGHLYIKKNNSVYSVFGETIK